MKPARATRLEAARHELRCLQCRVTWRSWFLRLLGIRKGYSPWVRPSRRWKDPEAAA